MAFQVPPAMKWPCVLQYAWASFQVTTPVEGSAAGWSVFRPTGDGDSVPGRSLVLSGVRAGRLLVVGLALRVGTADLRGVGGGDPVSRCPIFSLAAVLLMDAGLVTSGDGEPVAADEEPGAVVALLGGAEAACCRGVPGAITW
jgi:hypothetical protein